MHGHALEASALVEFVVTVLALRAGLLPVNAGFLAPDPECELNLVLGAAREASPRYAAEPERRVRRRQHRAPGGCRMNAPAALHSEDRQAADPPLTATTDLTAAGPERRPALA